MCQLLSWGRRWPRSPSPWPPWSPCLRRRRGAAGGSCEPDPSWSPLCSELSGRKAENIQIVTRQARKDIYWPQWRRRAAYSWGHHGCLDMRACPGSPGSPAWSGRTAPRTCGPGTLFYHLCHHQNMQKYDCLYSHQRGGPLVLAGEGPGLVAAHLLLLPPLGTQQLLETLLLLPEARHQLPRLAQLSRQSSHVSLEMITLITRK